MTKKKDSRSKVCSPLLWFGCGGMGFTLVDNENEVPECVEFIEAAEPLSSEPEMKSPYRSLSAPVFPPSGPKSVSESTTFPEGKNVVIPRAITLHPIASAQITQIPHP